MLCILHRPGLLQLHQALSLDAVALSEILMGPIFPIYSYVLKELLIESVCV